MTKGKKDSGDTIHGNGSPMSLRELSAYLHQQYGYAPWDNDAMEDLLAEMTHTASKAMKVTRKPAARDIMIQDPRHRVGFDRHGNKKKGSLASTVTKRAREILFLPCPVDAPPLSWGHAKKAGAAEPMRRVFLWSDAVFQPSPSLAGKTRNGGWMHNACMVAAEFLKEYVYSTRPYAGSSVPMDVFSGLLGHTMAKRQQRCIWPDGISIGVGEKSDAPSDRPSLGLLATQELATFFVDEPLFQLWDNHVWVIVAPQRAVVITKRKSIDSYAPTWVRCNPTPAKR